MTEDALINRKKKLIFRCGHRGTKEMDLLLGGFAKKHVMSFDESQLNTFEELITNSDPDIYNWMTKKEIIPEQWDSKVSQLLMNFEL